MTTNYATIEEGREARGLHPGDTASDADILLAIQTASRMIDSHCNVPPGAFAGESQTRYYTAIDPHSLVVDNLLEIGTSGIEVDSGYNRSYSATWATSVFDLYPANATVDGMPYWKIETVTTASGSFPVGQPRGVKITGTFGYSREAPPQIKKACLLLVSRLMARKGSDYGTIGGGDIGVFRIAATDPDVMKLLEPFRDPVVG
jgi:hypothetical protein